MMHVGLVLLTAGQLASGTGWTLLNSDYVTSFAPIRYVIKFDSQAALDKLGPYIRNSATETNNYMENGVRFSVSDQIVAANKTGCQDNGVIVVTYEYRPTGKAGLSWGGNCYNLADHTLHSGLMRINTEWWEPNWFSTSPAVTGWYIRNGITHEMGHAIGLGHPNKDLDSDGVVENHECEINTDGTLPVMCSPNGGWMKSYENGKWTPHDVAGLKALINNWQYR